MIPCKENLDAADSDDVAGGEGGGGAAPKRRPSAAEGAAADNTGGEPKRSRKIQTHLDVIASKDGWLLGWTGSLEAHSRTKRIVRQFERKKKKHKKKKAFNTDNTWGHA